MNALFLERPRDSFAKPFVKTPDAANESLYWAVWSIPRQPTSGKRERSSNSDSAKAKHQEAFFCDWS